MCKHLQSQTWQTLLNKDRHFPLKSWINAKLDKNKGNPIPYQITHNSKSPISKTLLPSPLLHCLFTSSGGFTTWTKISLTLWEVRGLCPFPFNVGLCKLSDQQTMAEMMTVLGPDLKQLLLHCQANETVQATERSNIGGSSSGPNHQTWKTKWVSEVREVLRWLHHSCHLSATKWKIPNESYLTEPSQP